MGYFENYGRTTLFNFRERSQLLNKHPRVKSVKEPRIGDVVQVKYLSTRGTWRIGHVIEMIESQDGKQRAAKVTKIYHTPVSFGM